MTISWIYIPDARYIGAAIAAGSAVGLTVALVRIRGERRGS